MEKLFSEYILNNVTIKNRVVMAPMVCPGWADDSGFVTDKHIKHYEARANGGVGTIIVEAHSVNKDARAFRSQLGIWSDRHIEGLSKIIDRCHAHGSKVLVQLYHAGLKTPKVISDKCVGPSSIMIGEQVGRELSVDEIFDLQKDFVNAAIRAKIAGADGIELHGAHGYLLNQFASPLINMREDKYGGSVANRTRFAGEIIEWVRRQLGNDFIIGYRMGGNEPTVEDAIDIATELERCGVDLIHVSSSGLSELYPDVPSEFNYNWIVYAGTQIKKQVRIPVIVVNGIKTPLRAAYLIENGLADFVAIGRDLMTDPEWVNKVRDNRKIDFCVDCRPKCKRHWCAEECPKYK